MRSKRQKAGIFSFRVSQHLEGLGNEWTSEFGIFADFILI